VQGKRNKELDEEFEARKKLPRIRMKTPMLVQASKLYKIIKEGASSKIQN